MPCSLPLSQLFQRTKQVSYYRLFWPDRRLTGNDSPYAFFAARFAAAFFADPARLAAQRFLIASDSRRLPSGVSLLLRVALCGAAPADPREALASPPTLRSAARALSMAPLCCSSCRMMSFRPLPITYSKLEFNCLKKHIALGMFFVAIWSRQFFRSSEGAWVMVAADLESSTCAWPP